MVVLHVAFQPSLGSSSTPHFLTIVVGGKASEPPHALKVLWLGVKYRRKKKFVQTKPLRQLNVLNVKDSHNIEANVATLGFWEYHRINNSYVRQSVINTSH